MTRAHVEVCEELYAVVARGRGGLAQLFIEIAFAHAKVDIGVDVLIKRDRLA